MLHNLFFLFFLQIENSRLQFTRDIVSIWYGIHNVNINTIIKLFGEPYVTATDQEDNILLIKIK